MAFDLSTWTTAKYRHSFTSDAGASVIWEIHEDGWSGGVADVEASGRSHCVTTWQHEDNDEYSALMPSETTIQLYDVGSSIVGDLIDNISVVEDKYLLVIRISNSLRWVGRIDPEGLRYNEEGPVQLTLTATDGIGRLADAPYISSTAVGGLPESISTLTSIISDVLSETGYGLNFYTSCSFYPKTAPALAATDNPLDNIYVNEYVFRNINGFNDNFVLSNRAKIEPAIRAGLFTGDPAKLDEDDDAISKLDVLTGVLTAFGLKLFQAEGKWHIIQANHLGGATSYRRWEYNSSGSAVGSPNYQDVTSGTSPSNPTLNRTTSLVGTLPAYSAVVVDYAHGSSNLLRLPTFKDVSRTRGVYAEPYPWESGSSSDSARVSNENGIFGWGINKVNNDPRGDAGFERVTEFPGVANLNNDNGSQPNNWDTLVGTKWARQTTKIETQTGDRFNLQFEVYPSSREFSLNGITVTGQQKSITGEDLGVMIKVTLDPDGGTPYFLQLDSPRSGTWTTDDKWMFWMGRLSIDAWNSIYVNSEATPVDGKIEVRLGPIMDASALGDYTGSYYNNVSLFQIADDGSIDYTRTATTNYINRSRPRPKSIGVRLGDGPTAYTAGALFTDVNRSNPTSDWEETTSGHSGTDTNEDLATVLGRAALTSMNKVRTVHERSWDGLGGYLSPLDVVLEGGSRYPAWNIAIDWNRYVTSGSWYKAVEAGFTDDLETGIRGGGSSLSDWGRGAGDQAGFFLNQLAQTFISDNATRITRTTSAINAGSGTSIINVLAIDEPLLQTGDNILLIAPDLSVYKLRIAANQAAGDTTLTVDDPDNPGSNYTFVNDVPSNANIFFAEDDLLTIARLGAMGFAVTVQGGNLGRVDGAQSGTLSQLNVRDWVVNLDPGDFVNIEGVSGTYEVYGDLGQTRGMLVGDTVMYFATSVDVGSLSDGDKIRPIGSVTRADFEVTADQISSFISSPGEGVATVSATPTFGGTNTDVPVGGSLTADLKAGDPVLLHSSSGSVVKATVFSDLSAGGSPIVLVGDQTSFIDTGDVVAAGSISGLRIDFDSIDVTSDALKSSNYVAGTSGWGIFNDGSAEFQDVTIRGVLNMDPGSSIGNAADFDMDNIGPGVNFGRVAASQLNGTGFVQLDVAVGDLDDIDDGGTYAKVLATSISAGRIVLTEVTGDLDDIADGSGFAKISQTIVAAGLIQIGTGTKDSTLNGFHFNASEIVGQASGVDQVVMNTSGQIVAGGGNITIDASGITATDSISININSSDVVFDGNGIKIGGGVASPTFSTNPTVIQFGAASGIWAYTRVSPTAQVFTLENSNGVSADEVHLNCTGGSIDIDAGDDITINSGSDIFLTFSSNIIVSTLPISATGLPTGALWNDSGTVKVA